MRTVVYRLRGGRRNIIGEAWHRSNLTFRTGKYSERNITGETLTTSVNFRTDQSFLNAASPVEPTGEGNLSLLCVFVFICVT